MRKKLLPVLVFCLIFYNANSQSAASDQLDINNIKARFLANGALFGGETSQSASDGFEAPVGSGKSTFYTGRLWIGGLDNNGQLRLAAERFSQVGNDFFSGPLTTDGSASCITGTDSIYNRVWKINRATIDSFAAGLLGNNIPSAIMEWPAHGDVSSGQSYYLAPFTDVNNDGVYNPLDGDYPKIRGDQAVFFIFNDNCHPHTETGAEPIGVEIHAMAYAFNCPQDSALANTVFLHYDIINRGSFILYNTYVGLWSDMDIGYANDDFIGCDVMRSSYFTYNGLNLDGTGGVGQYGAHPPVQSVTFLAGPFQDNNQLDDDFGIGAKESLNGYGFGDGIVDNERFGLSHFKYHNNSGGGGGPAQTDPNTALDYYNYLNGLWLDSIHMVYGGTGHPSGGGNPSVPANFMFPGDTDPLGWGTGGNPQVPWTETSSGNIPYDRRGLGTSGSFTFEPGEVTPFDIAFVFGIDYNGGPQESIAVMKERIDAIRTMFFADSTTCGGSISSVNKISPVQSAIEVYPNPFTDVVKIAVHAQNKNLLIELFNVNGSLVYSEQNVNSSNAKEVNLSKLNKGIYLLRISDKDGITHVQKIIKN